MIRALIPAFLLLLGSTLLGTTVFREQVANAAQSISATIVAPVDKDNNVAVHEQGTADVNVTGGSLSVAPPSPVTGGGNVATLLTGSESLLPTPATATALSIHLTSEVRALAFQYQGSEGNVVAIFSGPAARGNSSIVLALTRPIKFDFIACDGEPGGLCSVSWVGAEP